MASSSSKTNPQFSLSNRGRQIYKKSLADQLELPDLTEIQKTSYQWFFKEGLVELFDEFSPITDFIGRDLELSFSDFVLDQSKFNERDSLAKKSTYEASLRVQTKLLNKRSGEIKDQEVYLGDFPLMTSRGTFIINGIERVVVSQIVRSAGVFFSDMVVKGKKVFGVKIIPNRGAWLEIETDYKGVLWVKIDRKRKIALTAFLRALGFGGDTEMKELFKDVDTGEVSYLESTLAKDTTKTQADGLIDVYKKIRPGDLATADNAKSLIFAMFFNFDRYDFGRVGRYKINRRFGVDVPNDKDHRVLRKEDLTLILKELIRLNVTGDAADDIDHLGNRRIRTVGELLQGKVRIGFSRMERIIKDRMSTLDINTLTPNQLVNARPVVGVVKEFFMSSQLSQFMDQTNPLSELEHKRRLSAMGPGGLSRERAGFEVRDVHRTHYGRICPIATPEGPNIGLVGHLASYARVNEYGFIETPYLKVEKEVPNDGQSLKGKVVRADILNKKGKVIAKSGTTIEADLAKTIKAESELEQLPVKPRVSKDVVYIDAFTEEKGTTTPANTKLDKGRYFVEDKVEMRYHGQPALDSAEKVDYMDVSAKQIVSVTTSMIPFLEHDDAVRALMGTNMQRQAVPCLIPDSPMVGTGVEARAAEDAGLTVIAKADGQVTALDGRQITVSYGKGEVETHYLSKFERSNSSTCINQKMVVDVGQKFKKGDVLVDGSSIDNGEIALGQNVLVAFIPWEGFNFEDAIIISDRLVREDVYSSIHIKEYTVDVRETKLGPEVVTRDIPNVSEEKLKDLDIDGIVRVGAKVSSGSILVGKITPKGETELSAEEKLLRAIFGEKAKDMRDSSLYVDHGENGKVVSVKIFSRAEGDNLASGIVKSIQVSVATIRKIQVGDKMAGRHGNKGVISRVLPVEDMPVMADGTAVDIILNPMGVASRMNIGQILETHLGLAAYTLKYKIATPALNSLPTELIESELVRAGFESDGKVQLFDGRSGQKFNFKSTVGVMYMLKLNHLVDDKIHQRSIGPYSMVTQQPLGGRAQFGGQRFGEMEVWALEAYGAAHTLQEILTIKSDDVPGRAKAYESIIKGEEITRLNIPESFNVLVRELKSLGLSVELLKNDKVVKQLTYEDSKESKSFNSNSN